METPKESTTPTSTTSWGTWVFLALVTLFLVGGALSKQDDWPMWQSFGVWLVRVILVIFGLWMLGVFSSGFVDGWRSSFRSGPWRPDEADIFNNRVKALLDRHQIGEPPVSKIEDLISKSPAFSELRPRRQGSKNLVVAEAKRIRRTALIPFLETYAWPLKYRGELNRLLRETKDFLRWVPDEEVLDQLLRYAGVLSDETAARVLETCPTISRDKLCEHIRLAWGGTGYPRLVELALTEKDEVLLDHLAGEFLQHEYWSEEAVVSTGEPLAQYFESLGTSSLEFATRSAEMLLRLPEGKIRDVNLWKAKNPLSALFLVQANTYLDHSDIVARLLKAESSLVQEMILRRLASRTELAPVRAQENLKFLESCLTRPIAPQLRSLALDAMEQGVSSEADARPIVKTMLRVLRRPDKHYPHEKVRGVLNKWKVRWPKALG